MAKTTKTEARPEVRLVRARETCFIDNCLRQAGDVFETSSEITPDGPICDANEEIAPQRPKPTRRATKSVSGQKGVDAPEWTTAGFKEQNGIQGPVGMGGGKSSEIAVTPP